MSEYLSKEEIKQWRSSLEKITLEEFAARLGKKVEEKKETNDLIDIFLHGKPVVADEPKKFTKAERLSGIADKAYEREKEIYKTPFSAKNLKVETFNKDNASTKKVKNENLEKDNKPKTKETKVKKVIEPKTEVSGKKAVKAVKEPKKKVSKNAHLETAQKVIENSTTNDELRNEVRLALKKSLTQREQKVLEYFKSHKNEIVYAKDLAVLLGVPRDYVYKYIKNIREKIEAEDAITNADKGGFIFNV